MEESAFRGVLGFFDRLGVYDVILPFLLVFVIVFAVLEKSKIFGTEKIGNEEYTKKNLNAIVAFSIAFIVVASTKIVAVINESLANVALMLIVGFSFLLLVGIFFGSGESIWKGIEGWRGWFIAIMFIATVLIFLHAIKDKEGTPWLTKIIDILINQWSTTAVASIIMVIIVIGIMIWIVKEPKPREEKKSS